VDGIVESIKGGGSALISLVGYVAASLLTVASLPRTMGVRAGAAQRRALAEEGRCEGLEDR